MINTASNTFQKWLWCSGCVCFGVTSPILDTRHQEDSCLQDLQVCWPRDDASVAAGLVSLLLNLLYPPFPLEVDLHSYSEDMESSGS